MNPATATTTPEPRLAAAAELQISASVEALEAGPLGQAEVVGQERGSGDEPEVPAVAEQEQGDEQDRTRPPAGRPRRGSARAPVTSRPPSTTARLPNRSVRRPEIGDRANIPKVWPLMTSPTAAEVVAVLGHVERRHRHDQDHHDLAGDEGDDGRRDVRPAEDLAARRRSVVARPSR